MTKLSIVAIAFITLTAGTGCKLGASTGVSGPGTSSTGASAGDSDDGEVPSALQGLQEMADRIDKRLGDLEGASSVSERDLQFARIDVVSFLTNIHRGGTNAGECTVCFDHPLHATLKAKFPAFDARMSKLEKRYGHCTFGHQMADGKILALTIEWSHAEWMQIMEKSKHKQARCWLDEDRDAYL